MTKLHAIAVLTTAFLALAPAPGRGANPATPWGAAAPARSTYTPHKVVYDVAVDGPERLERLLDRVSFLNNLYSADPFTASIVLVLHGPEIRFFAIRDLPKHRALMERAQSLTVGGTVQFRVCEVAAKAQGLAPRDVHGFVQMVPMGDAEIIRLQGDGYAYMR